MCLVIAARMCPVAGSPVDGLRVVSSIATCARAASRNSSTDAARGPNSAASSTSADSPAASTAVPCRNVWTPVIVKGNSWRFCLTSRASARPTLPYPIIASFKVRLYRRTQLVDSALILQCLQVPFGACESLVVYLLCIRKVSKALGLAKTPPASRRKGPRPPHFGRPGSLPVLPLRLFPALLYQFF